MTLLRRSKNSGEVNERVNTSRKESQERNFCYC